MPIGKDLEPFHLKPGQGPEERRFSTIAIGVEPTVAKQIHAIESAADLLASCIAASIGEDANSHRAPASAIHIVQVEGITTHLAAALANETLARADWHLDLPISTVDTAPHLHQWLYDHLEELADHGKMSDEATILRMFSQKSGSAYNLTAALRNDVRSGLIQPEATLVIGPDIPDSPGILARLLHAMEKTDEHGKQTRSHQFPLLLTSPRGLSPDQQRVLGPANPDGDVTVHFVPVDDDRWRHIEQAFEDGMAGKRPPSRILPIR